MRGAAAGIQSETLNLNIQHTATAIPYSKLSKNQVAEILIAMKIGRGQLRRRRVFRIVESTIVIVATDRELPDSAISRYAFHTKSRPWDADFNRPLTVNNLYALAARPGPEQMENAVSTDSTISTSPTAVLLSPSVHRPSPVVPSWSPAPPGTAELELQLTGAGARRKGGVLFPLPPGLDMPDFST